MSEKLPKAPNPVWTVLQLGGIAIAETAIGLLALVGVVGIATAIVLTGLISERRA